MRSKRTRGVFVLVLALSCSSLAVAAPRGDALQELRTLPPPIDIALASHRGPAAATTLTQAPAVAVSQAPVVAASAGTGTNMRRLLADFALDLLDIRYRRGGRSPATGFDCSGFVHYVFRHSVGEELAASSAAQFRNGSSISRSEMKTGDLVFFRTHGKRISHVGIYLDHGRFIHSPSSGKRISISRLDEAYWAKRFAGARRPDVLS
ncbi:MAG: C40 family peptidase [Xanthomonadales bacterium]|nr:C40 family peptidase [Xanthomonadales bacterium]